jgi:uncharacterized surface protein with fasciclin (FAS1) repeats
MKVRLFAAVAIAAVLGISLPAPATQSKSIFDTLALSKDHSIMHVAVTEAKEINTLQSPGPHLLFAPTDAAFKKLGDATIKKIASDKETVRKLVRAHLVDAKFTAKDLGALDGKELLTREGGSLKVEALKDGIRIGGAKLTVADILCSNGVIHTIDVVLPFAKD